MLVQGRYQKNRENETRMIVQEGTVIKFDGGCEL